MNSHETKTRFPFISLFLTCLCILGAINAYSEYDPGLEKKWMKTKGAELIARTMAQSTYDVCMEHCIEPGAITPCHACEQESVAQYRYTLNNTDRASWALPYSNPHNNKTYGWVLGAMFFGFFFYILLTGFLNSRRKDNPLDYPKNK